MIAAAEAQRNLIITLQLISDPGNEVTAQKVHKQTIAVEVSVTKAAEEGAKKRGDIEKDIFRERDQILNQSISDKQKREKRVGMLAVRDAKKIAKDRKMISQQVTKAIAQDQKQMTSDIKAAKAQHVAANRKALESGLAAIQGTQDLVEGMRTLGLISEESFEKFTHGFKNVNTGIQVFKGLSEIIWKSREALIALNSATKAQATANALMSASNLRTTATSKLANVAIGISGGRRGRSTRGSGGRAAIGAITEGVLGAETIAGGKALLPLIGGIAKVGAIGLVAFEGIQALRRGIFGASESTESLIGAFIDYRREAANAEKSTKKLAAAEKDRSNRQDNLKRFNEDESKRAGFRQTLRSGSALGRNVNFDISGANRDPIKSAENERLEALREVRAAEKDLASTRIHNEERIRRGQFASAENRLRASKALVEAGGRLIEADRRRLSVMREQNTIAKDQIKSAKNDLNSLRARFAELSPGVQSRLRVIGENNKAGVALSRADELFLRDETGGLGAGLLKKSLAKRAKASGSDATLESIGETDEIIRRLKEAQDREKRTNTVLAVKAEAKLKSDVKQQQKNIKKQVRNEAEVERISIERESPPEFIQKFDPNFILFPTPAEKRRQRGKSRPAEAPDVNSLKLAKPPAQQAAGEAADTITQESVAVSQSMKTVLDAVVVGFGEIKDTAENHQILRRVYS